MVYIQPAAPSISVGKFVPNLVSSLSILSLRVRISKVHGIPSSVGRPVSVGEIGFVRERPFAEWEQIGLALLLLRTIKLIEPMLSAISRLPDGEEPVNLAVGFNQLSES